MEILIILVGSIVFTAGWMTVAVVIIDHRVALSARREDARRLEERGLKNPNISGVPGGYIVIGVMYHSTYWERIKRFLSPATRKCAF